MGIFLRIGAWYRATNKALPSDIEITGIIDDPNAEYPTADEIADGGATPNLDTVLAVVPATLTEDRTVDLNAFTLAVIHGVYNLLEINPTLFKSSLQSNDGTSQAEVRTKADTADEAVSVILSAESGANNVRVMLNALTALITLSGSDVIIEGLAGGGTTGLSIDNDGKIIRTP